MSDEPKKIMVCAVCLYPFSESEDIPAHMAAHTPQECIDSLRRQARQAYDEKAASFAETMHGAIAGKTVQSVLWSGDNIVITLEGGGGFSFKPADLDWK